MEKTFVKFTAGILAVIFSLGTIEAHAFTGQIAAPSISAYGRVDETWKSVKSSSPHVYFIQDAHDSVEAQKNIAGLIEELVRQGGVEKVFEEGYEGRVPVGRFFDPVAPDIKKRAADYYLHQLLISGAEYAAIHRKSENRVEGIGDRKDKDLKELNTKPYPLNPDWQIIGVEDTRLYLENLQAYQTASRYQGLIAGEIAGLKQEVKNALDQKAGPGQKEFMRKWTGHENGRISVLEYAKDLTRLLAKEGAVLPPAASRMQDLFSGKVRQVPAMRLFTADLDFLQSAAENRFFPESPTREGWERFKLLVLLERLSRMEINSAEARAASGILADQPTEAVVHWLGTAWNQSLAFSKAWEALISTAVGFYETADRRDRVVIKRLSQLRAGETAALVFGGFHREHLTQLMREAGVSYTVITPKFSGLQTQEQIQYRRLMMTSLDSVLSPVAPASANRQPGAFFACAQRVALPVSDPFHIFSFSDGSTPWPEVRSVRSAALSRDFGTDFLTSKSRSPFRSEIRIDPVLMEIMVAGCLMGLTAAKVLWSFPWGTEKSPSKLSVLKSAKKGLRTMSEDEFVDFLDLKSGDRVIEVGPGSNGNLGLLLWSRGADVEAVDLRSIVHARLLKKQRDNYPEYPSHGTYRFVEGDYLEQDYGSSSARVLIARNVLDSPDGTFGFKERMRKPMIRKMIREVREGGWLIYSSLMPVGLHDLVSSVLHDQGVEFEEWAGVDVPVEHRIRGETFSVIRVLKKKESPAKGLFPFFAPGVLWPDIVSVLASQESRRSEMREDPASVAEMSPEEAEEIVHAWIGTAEAYLEKQAAGKLKAGEKVPSSDIGPVYSRVMTGETPNAVKLVGVVTDLRFNLARIRETEAVEKAKGSVVAAPMSPSSALDAPVPEDGRNAPEKVPSSSEEASRVGTGRELNKYLRQYAAALALVKKGSNAFQVLPVQLVENWKQKNAERPFSTELAKNYAKLFELHEKWLSQTHVPSVFINKEWDAIERPLDEAIKGKVREEAQRLYPRALAIRKLIELRGASNFIESERISEILARIVSLGFTLNDEGLLEPEKTLSPVLPQEAPVSPSFVTDPREDSLDYAAMAPESTASPLVPTVPEEASPVVLPEAIVSTPVEEKEPDAAGEITTEVTAVLQGFSLADRSSEIVQKVAIKPTEIRTLGGLAALLFSGGKLPGQVKVVLNGIEQPTGWKNLALMNKKPYVVFRHPQYRAPMAAGIPLPKKEEGWKIQSEDQKPAGNETEGLSPDKPFPKSTSTNPELSRDVPDFSRELNRMFFPMLIAGVEAEKLAGEMVFNEGDETLATVLLGEKEHLRRLETKYFDHARDVLKWILKKQEIARERLKAGWIDGFERVFRKRTNPEDGVFKDSTFIPEIERMIQDVRVVIAREESSDVETPVRSESRKMESPQAFAAVSEAMQKIKESRLLVRIFMEAADFEILDEDQMLELRKTLVWDRRVKLLVGEAGSLRGASAVRFKGLQKEFFERHQVLEEDGSSSKTSPKTAWIQMTKNPGLRPRPGIHSFLYEDGMPGLLPVALLYSLTHEAETRLIRISKMDAQWRLFGRDFLNSLVVSFRQIAQAA